LPVAAKIALHSAGATGGTLGLADAGRILVDGTRCVSITGHSNIRSERYVWKFVSWTARLERDLLLERRGQAEDDGAVRLRRHEPGG